MGGEMKVYSLTREELQDWLDIAKVAVLTQVVKDGLLTSDVADDWAATHGVILQDKTIWRTLTARWANEPVQDGKVLVRIVTVK